MAHMERPCQACSHRAWLAATPQAGLTVLVRHVGIQAQPRRWRLRLVHRVRYLQWDGGQPGGGRLRHGRASGRRAAGCRGKPGRDSPAAASQARQQHASSAPTWTSSSKAVDRVCLLRSFTARMISDTMPATICGGQCERHQFGQQVSDPGLLGRLSGILG